MSTLALEGFRPALQQTLHWSSAEERTRLLYLTLALPDGVDRQRLRTSLKQVLERHEILRTRLMTGPGMEWPVQVIAEQAAIDWHDSRDSTPNENLKALLRECLSQPTAPALAVALL
ncbi:hypothetical protein JWR97_21870, partial [Pseudomonas cedrina subsp. fulgida]|nr:hypothetical protein [Pseudomonas cedrina subsp. fulgida]